MPSSEGAGRAPYGSSTVDKAIDIIEAVASSREGMSNQEISDQLGLDRSTAHRLVSTLERRRLLERSEHRRFTIGSYLYFMALDTGFDLGVVVRHALREIVETTGESASFSIRNGHNYHCAYNQLSPHELSYCSTVGSDYPLYSGAAGYAIWAFLPPIIRDRVLEEIEPAELTEATVTHKDELREVLTQTAERGYARSAGVRTPGGCAVSAPVFGRHGGVVGVLTLSAAESRVPLAELERFAPLLQSRARQISEIFDGAS